VKVTNLHLQKSSQFTEFTIVCDGPSTFTHQIVEAAANKPFRIVIDVSDAVQSVPKHSYKGLPDGAVKQVRISQYSIEPQKVVRVVLDVTGSLTYKAKENGNTLTVFINTPADKDFLKWSAVGDQAGEPVMAKKEEPAEMLKTTTSAPGNEAGASKVERSQPEKQEAKLATKPIDEGKLLNKVVKPVPVPAKSATLPAADKSAKAPTTPVVSEKSSASPNPELLEKVNGAKEPAQTSKTASAAKQEAAPIADKDAGKTAASSKAQDAAVGAQPIGGIPPTQKHVDSAITPLLKPGTGGPPTEPADATKPPKTQKSSLPETKVNKAPKLAEGVKTANPVEGKLGTAVESKTPTAKVAVAAEEKQQNAVKEGTTPAAPQTRSEAIRQRYLAEKGRINPDEQPALDSAELAEEEGQAQPLSDIEKIRMKYKRGIKFVQNDQDDREQASAGELSPADTQVATLAVGPYSEFLPEREIIVYTTSGRPDPFEPLVEDAASNAQSGDLPDVEALRLVGILQDKSVSRALFEDFKGCSYILKTGDRVKNGFVLSIEENRVLFQIRQYGWNRQVAVDLESEK
jgi:hypothetical protein